MHLRYISLKLTSCTFLGECGKWLLPVSKNQIQSKKDFTCGLRTPEQCAAGSDESPRGDTPAVRGAATALVRVGLHSVYRQRDHVLWLYIFCGIFVTPSRQVIMWQFMVHSDFQCSHSWLEPLAKAPMKTDKIGEGRGFPSTIKDETDNLVAESAHRTVWLCFTNAEPLCKGKKALPMTWARK